MKAIMFAGQGTQFRGMGKELFRLFPTLVSQANSILGYDIAELCTLDPQGLLNKTEFTQPAIFTVNALHYLNLNENQNGTADFYIGHSLGEYNALMAAGAFDFSTGLTLVKKRGQLMSQARDGGMLAVLGTREEQLQALLAELDLRDIVIANYNTPTQLILSGPHQSTLHAFSELEKRGIKVVPLNVQGAFHSHMMQYAQQNFEQFLKDFQFSALHKPVIANVNGQPYEQDRIHTTLSQQLSSPVRWCDSIRYLMACGVDQYHECGERLILSKMVDEITQQCDPMPLAATHERQAWTETSHTEEVVTVTPLLDTELNCSFTSATLGNILFRQTYHVKYAYVCGSMYRGIASKEMVINMARNGMLAFLGAGGLPLDSIRQDVIHIKNAIADKASFGVNFLCNLNHPDAEMDLVRLLVDLGVNHIEASAFVTVTPALVWYRIAGLEQGADGAIKCNHHIMAKLSRPEVADVFLSPAPQRIVDELLTANLITLQQAEWSRKVPMSHAICVEADSGGHTDMGNPTILFPTMKKLCEAKQAHHQYAQPIFVGLAGGIGTPESAAAAFFLGADFILTGSINQCTVESGASDAVKDILQTINVKDTAYAPAGDMFEIGAKIQVLKKGTFFAARANKLYQIYNHFDGIDDIPHGLREQIETHYFKNSLEDIWKGIVKHLMDTQRPQEVEKANALPKYKMCLIFKYYFYYSSQLALQGDPNRRVDYQVHTGPALGAFNQWVKGSDLESWKNRHVHLIAEKLMMDTAAYMQAHIQQLLSPFMHDIVFQPVEA
ncbi:ACP S-malonyltransferase [Cellvibrio japonicus]|uniref:[acyl-carrier-protein] S-malonyltransferase n=1 Tax=Cellvibrio japonicus (strain Ueda107) TaxID=498211 RepID=B3PCT7_CELJU|nr:ACP S-malonyltransferase [Cellvibrio japonicus]ACE85007.1 involved in polyketide synthesis [Cellvibrio japonicus Ueda107]QEI13306.1 ACP S-malonyltransferase [Cellvibrio japonicus]QEI16880.1 ACP S-malonyltransferase [Cellvibrio japonicus]QEI20458.1 ACP S-malonyltransferase [Cellvibrio japonicus]